jgi:hypothetical protein
VEIEIPIPDPDDTPEETPPELELVLAEILDRLSKLEIACATKGNQTGETGPPGPPGESPTAAEVAAELKKDPEFLKGVAAMVPVEPITFQIQDSAGQVIEEYEAGPGGVVPLQLPKRKPVQ